jgi:two-component system response regulator RegX3
MNERTETAMLALVVDDERNVRFLLRELLSKDGFEVTCAANGAEALDLLHDTRFDLVVLDLRLGGRIGGMRVLETARWRWPNTAAVILTAHGTLETAVEAIREDVDGYLLKPVESRDFLVAVHEAIAKRASLRRAQGEEEHPLVHGVIHVDVDKHMVTVEGELVELTPQEFKLLVCLITNRERVVPPKELARVVRDYTPDSTHEARQIIKWYVHRLRAKIEPNPRKPRYIVNVRGVGYTMGPIEAEP